MCSEIEADMVGSVIVRVWVGFGLMDRVLHLDESFRNLSHLRCIICRYVHVCAWLIRKVQQAGYYVRGGGDGNCDTDTGGGGHKPHITTNTAQHAPQTHLKIPRPNVHVIALVHAACRYTCSHI